MPIGIKLGMRDLKRPVSPAFFRRLSGFGLRPRFAGFRDFDLRASAFPRGFLLDSLRWTMQSVLE